MTSQERPSREHLFSVWLAAIRGDEEAKRLLFKIQLQHPATKKVFKGFAKQRAADASRKAKQFLPKKGRRPLSDWEKASNTVTNSGAHFVSGGLPSLGKNR